VNTATAKVDDAFEALVIAPVVVVDGRIAMAAGATLTGHVKEVTAAVNPDDQAVLPLAFDEIRDANGKKLASRPSSAVSTTPASRWTPTAAFRASSRRRRGRVGWIKVTVVRRHPAAQSVELRNYLRIIVIRLRPDQWPRI